MGDRGTGKSTTIRALADLLPGIQVVAGDPYNSSPIDPDLQSTDVRERLESGENISKEERQVPMVDLPLGATEDRVCGTIDIEKALTEGVKAFEPGLLAKAKEIQEDLRKLAASSDTTNSSGLSLVLQETTLALLRQPDLWVYANVEHGVVPLNTVETTFNRLSILSILRWPFLSNNTFRRISSISLFSPCRSFLATYGYAIAIILNFGSSFNARPSWLTTDLIISANLAGTLNG